MRSLSVAATAIAAFIALLTIAATNANAVVCAKGVARAGCATAGGAAVVRTTPACRYVMVNGVRVRRCA